MTPNLSSPGVGGLLVTLAALLAPPVLPAQLVVSRNFAPVTLTNSAPTGLLSATAFFGEVQRGFGSAEDELAWNLKLAGVLQLYRWKSAALVATAGHELTANPFNSIGFNPRGATWEETLAFVRRAGTLHWHVAAFHRCRHEIDNSHPPDESDIDPSYVPTARLLSLTGLRAGLTSPALTPGGSTTMLAFVEGERYATTTDNRTPRNTAPPFWKRALGAARVGVSATRQLAPAQHAYVRGWSSLMFFSRGPGRPGVNGQLQWRTEVGLRVIGAARNGADVFAAYERTFDDVTRPVPQPSGTLGVGLRFEPR